MGDKGDVFINYYKIHEAILASNFVGVDNPAVRLTWGFSQVCSTDQPRSIWVNG